MVQNAFLALSVLATSAFALKDAQMPLGGSDMVMPPLNMADKDLTFGNHDEEYSMNDVPKMAPNGTRLAGPIDAPQAAVSSNMVWATSVTKRPSSSIYISSVGVRKGGEVSTEAFTAKIDLDTAYTSLPDFVYDIFMQSTRALQPEEMRDTDEVDCSTISSLPELIVGIGASESEELTLQPNQYIKRTKVIDDEDEYETCELLVRKAEVDEEEITLGYPAMKGRRVVFDWAEGRVGFDMTTESA